MSLNDEAEFLVTTDWEIVEVEDLEAGTPGPVGSDSEPMLDALAVSNPDAGPYRVLRSDEYGYRGYAEFMLKQFKSAPADAPTTSVRQMIDHLERCLADLQ